MTYVFLYKALLFCDVINPIEILALSSHNFRLDFRRFSFPSFVVRGRCIFDCVIFRNFATCSSFDAFVEYVERQGRRFDPVRS